jgi:hypothetical protein
MVFSIKAIGFGLGALLATGGMFLITLGTSTGNSSASSSGWELVIIAVIMWVAGFVVRNS